MKNQKEDKLAEALMRMAAAIEEISRRLPEANPTDELKKRAFRLSSNDKFSPKLLFLKLFYSDDYVHKINSDIWDFAKQRFPKQVDYLQKRFEHITAVSLEHSGLDGEYKIKNQLVDLIVDATTSKELISNLVDWSPSKVENLLDTLE